AQELGGRGPDRPQRADGPGTERGIDEKLQPGARPDVADGAEHTGHAGDHDQGQHGDPPVTVGTRSDGQAGRAAARRAWLSPPPAPPTAARRSRATSGSCPATAAAPAAAAPPRPASPVPASPA